MTFRQYLIVCAIDLGTTSTSCFFSSLSDFRQDRLRIYSILRHTTQGFSQEDVSCLLLNAEEKVDKFGVDAEEKYNDLVSEGTEKDWFFFKGFKMILYDQMNFKKTSSLMDVKGKRIPAKKVFTGLLDYLRRETIATLGETIEESEIRWVLPVPVVWNNVAIEFMREAAEDAGILPSRLIMASEPDMALVLSMHLQDDKHVLRPGTKCIVLDCGGGKIDVTIFDILSDFDNYDVQTNIKCKEILKKNITGVSGNNLKEKFWILLNKLFGDTNVKTFRKEDTSSARDLLQQFEKKILSFRRTTEKVVIKLPASLLFVLQTTSRDERHHLPEEYENQISIHGDKLSIKSSVISAMFDDLCEGIRKYVDPLLSNEKLQNLNTAVMVGGLSASELVRDFMKSRFQHVIVSEEPSFATVKGAVIYGHIPNLIKVERGGVEHLIVAAIDFGTTFSGYAFSSLSQYKSNPLEVLSFTWTDDNVSSQKTSTCVLFAPDRSVHSVGFEAEETYADLASEDEHNEWFFFKRFKMMLYQKRTIDRDVTLIDDTGKEMDALIVFAAIIHYMKEHFKKECDQRIVGILDSEIKWILTVPAIWNDSAKQFMREAAEKAGIDSNQLSLVLEPEAASLFCRYSLVERSGGDIVAMQPNTKYIVLDCGGGTVDITVHEVLGGSLIKEIYKVNGGNWGGTTVDRAFWRMLNDIFGEAVITTFTETCKYDELDVIKRFELKKRSIKPDSDREVIMSLPESLHRIYKKNSKVPLLEKIQEDIRYKNNITWKAGKLKFSAKIGQSFFNEATDSIVRHVQNLLAVPCVRDIDIILMVGGFSESPMLQHAIKDSFPRIKVLTPYDSGMAVLKGAVLYGHEPNVLQSRVCKYTYGVETTMPFEDGVDPERFLIYVNGERMCQKRFQIHVREGEDVTLDSPPVSKVVEFDSTEQCHFSIPIYMCAGGDPRYVTECTRIGDVKIDLDDEIQSPTRRFTIEMVFGYIESKVKVTDMVTGRIMTSKFDFLG